MVLGREPIPPGHGDGEAVPSGSRGCEPILPATVVAAHLATCAEELSRDTAANPGSVGELAEVMRSLVAGQHYISAALGGLAEELGRRQSSGALATVPAPDLAVLTEVLRAASGAVGHSADALVEGQAALDVVGQSAGEDTRL
jgi:hypothetical protein